jgi:phosphate transport system substrate-binding protein
MEAFVFFVHKDNPIDNLTTEQIKGIYSGEITNWKQLGGKDEPIAAFQRNEGSGSQSMLIRFMDGTPIMEPPTEMVNTFMDGIIEQVANYRSKGGSIGFSFRYYMEGMIKNPDVKLLSIDGVAPTPENIRNGTYPITTFLYAVTCEGNDNENVSLLLDWVLSEEGQYIIGETGYIPIKE